VTHKGAFGLRAQNAAPTTSFDRSAAWTIDRALKALTTACDDEGIAFPGVYLVTVDAASVRVTVSKPSAKAPAGWTASSDGRTWSAQLAALQASNVRDTDVHSFAGLVMLGASDDGQVLLDLDQAAGPISVAGPKGAVDGIVEAWGTELTTNPWSATVRVARINARNEPNLEIAENLLADLDAGERALIVFEEPPSRSQTVALRALLASATTAWVLIKGTTPVATWKFTADGGVLSSGFLPDIRYSGSPGTSRRTSPSTPRRTSPGTPRRRLQWNSPWVLGGTSAVIVVVVAAVAAAMLSGGGTRINTAAATSSASPAASGAGKVAPTASASAASHAASHKAASTHAAAPTAAANTAVAGSSTAPQQSAGSATASPRRSAGSATASVPEPVSWWPLNDRTGTTALDSMGVHPATASNINWCIPQYGSCAAFNGTDSDIVTSGPVLDTAPGSSFTVSAVVDMTAIPANGASATIVSQDSTYDSGFYLQYSGANQRWAFSRVAADTDTGPAGIRAVSTSGPALNTWTHLVGVFNASDNQLRLYVNGVLQGTATDSSPFAATGDLAIGRAQFDGKPTDWFEGAAGEIKVYNKALTATQVGKI
jgi:Concanavalin A-like lectin/glucanases superfamily